MYQHIQLRKLSKISSNASSSKLEALQALKRKNRNNFFNDDGEFALKELSNEMGELEEVILVEDEPALQLPQLSNECWSNFVEELTVKYEHGNSLNSSISTAFLNIGAENKSNSRVCNPENPVSTVYRDPVSTNDERLVVRICSDEDDRCSPGICAGKVAVTKILDTKKSCSPAPCESLCEPVNTEALLESAGTEPIDEQQNIESGRLHQRSITIASGSLNIEQRKTAVEINVNLSKNVVSDHNHLQNKGISDSINCVNGTNKKYEEIKDKSYKLIFHQILQTFDIEKPVPGDPIDLDFPDLVMKEFVKTVKDFQETEATEDVKHLWTQVKIWLSAMKSPYGTSNYTKYHKKLNWYMTELMASYIKFEIENGTKSEFNYKLKIESLTNIVSSLLNDDVKLKILTLLRTDFPEKMGNFMDDLFRKFLTHPKVRSENSDYGTYRLKILAFHKWMYYTNRRKEDIVELAVKDGSSYLPKLVPINSVDPYYRVDYKAQLINEYDKHGTRKLLEENISEDMLKTSIDEYLQVYENQLNDDFGLSIFPRQGLENSKLPRTQNVTSREDPMCIQRHSLQPATLRNDVGHCRWRRPHCSNLIGSSSRAAHLTTGYGIHRNRLSTPLKSNRHSCKLLACKKHSDTRLRCTNSVNDIISLDSTDDEDENEKKFNEKSKSITEKMYQSSHHKKPTTNRQSKSTRHIDRKNTISRHTKARCPHLLRNEFELPREVDTIVLDSSSEGEETSSIVVSKESDIKPDNVVVQQQVVPTAELQQAPRSQRNVSRPLRCALIASVAIKPIRKEKHCIPGEVSSTTSHDILESERENQAPAISSSASLELNNASAYANAREVGTVEILERRELRQPVVMAERCFQPGKLLLGIDYSDDDNDDDDAVDRTRVNATAGSDAGEDDEISNGCVLPTAGYSKVVEEATSSTEIFLRTQPVGCVPLSTVLRAVEPAPLVATTKEDAPTCSRYAYSTAPTKTEFNNSIQRPMSKVTPQAVESKENVINMNQKSGGDEEVSLISSADLPTKRINVDGDTAEGRTERDNCVDPGIFSDKNEIEDRTIENEKNFDTGLEKLANEENVATGNSEIHNAKEENLKKRDSSVGSNKVVPSTENCGFSDNHDENAAIDQILADIDENLRKSSEINIKQLKEKNNTNSKGNFVGICGTLDAGSTDTEVWNSLTKNSTEVEEHKNCPNIKTAAINFESIAENDRSILNRLGETKNVESWTKDVSEKSCLVVGADTVVNDSTQNFKVKSIAKRTELENRQTTRTSAKVESKKIEKGSNKPVESSLDAVCKVARDVKPNNEETAENHNLHIGDIEEIENLELRRNVARLHKNTKNQLLHREDGDMARKKGACEKAKPSIKPQTNRNDPTSESESVTTPSLIQDSLTNVKPEEKVNSVNSAETGINRPNDSGFDNIAELRTKDVGTPAESEGVEPSAEGSKPLVCSNQEPLACVEPSDTKIDNKTEPRSKEVEEPEGDEPVFGAAGALDRPKGASHVSIDSQECSVNKKGECKVDGLSEEPLLEKTNRTSESEVDNITDSHPREVGTSVASNKDICSVAISSVKAIGKSIQLKENLTIESDKTYYIKNETLKDNAQTSLANSGRAKEIGETVVSKNYGTSDGGVSCNIYQDLQAKTIFAINKDSEPNVPTGCDSNKEAVFISTQPTGSDADQEHSSFAQSTIINENLTATTNASKEKKKTFEQLSEGKDVNEECSIEHAASLTNTDSLAAGVDKISQDENGHSKECIENAGITAISRRDVPESNLLSANIIIDDLLIESHNPNKNEREAEKNKLKEMNGDGDNKSMSKEVMQTMTSSYRELLTSDQTMEFEESSVINEPICSNSEKLKVGHIEKVKGPQEPKETASIDVEGTSSNNQDLSLSTNFGTPIEEEISLRTHESETGGVDVSSEKVEKTPILSEFETQESARCHLDFEVLSKIDKDDLEVAATSKGKEKSNISKFIDGNDSECDTGVTEAVQDVESIKQSKMLEIKDTAKENEEPTIASNQHTNTDEGSSMELQESQLVNEYKADQKNGSSFCSTMAAAGQAQVLLSNADVLGQLKQCTQISESVSNEMNETCFFSSKDISCIKEQLNINTESLIVDEHCSSLTKKVVPLVQDVHVNDDLMQTALKENTSKDCLANNTSYMGASVTPHRDSLINTTLAEELQKLDPPREVKCGDIKEFGTEVVEAPILLKERPSQNTDSKTNNDNVEESENVFEDSDKSVDILVEKDIEPTELTDGNKGARSSDFKDSVSGKPEIPIGIERKSSPQGESNIEILNEINSKAEVGCSIKEQESNLVSDSQANKINEQITDRQTLLPNTDTFATDDDLDVTNDPQKVRPERQLEFTTLEEGKCEVNDECNIFDKPSPAEASHSKSPPNVTEPKEIDEEVAAKMPTNSCDENDIRNDKMQETDQGKYGASEPLMSLTGAKNLPLENESEQRRAVQSSIVTKLVSDDRSAIKEAMPDEAENAKNYIKYTGKQLDDGGITTSRTTDANNSDSSYVALNTLTDRFDINKDEAETLETLTKRNEKAKEHRFSVEKSTVDEDRVEAVSLGSCKISRKRKAGRSSHRKLFLRKVDKRTARKMRIKHRISQCSDASKELNLGNMEAFKSSANRLSHVEQNQRTAAYATAEELAYNISKLVIKDNREVDENTIVDENKHEQEQEICSLENIANVGVTNTECPETSVASSHDNSAKSVELELQKESEELILSEDCHTFQCLPSEYNSEEILAVTTLINMRNNYTSVCSTSSYTDGDTDVAEVPLKTTQNEDSNKSSFMKTYQKQDKPTLKSALKKTNAKDGLVKKRVHFEEKNLMELINEKQKPSASTSKFTKKIQKFRSAEGVLLKGGNKTMKRRLLELNLNLSIDEEDRLEDIIEVIPEVKKRRGRTKIEPVAIENASEEIIVPTTANEPNDTLKTLGAKNDMPIYPVRLTSRRKNEPVTDVHPPKSVKNITRRIKVDHQKKIEIEDVGSDFIVPDEKVVSLRLPAKENIVNVSQISVDATKMKLKVAQVDTVERQKSLAADKQVDKPTSKIDKITPKAKPSLQMQLLKKAIIKIKRIKPPTYDIANSKTVISAETGNKDLLPSIQESPAEYTTPVSETLVFLSESPSPLVECSDSLPPVMKLSTSTNVTYGTNLSKIKRTKPIHKAANSKTSNEAEGSTQHQPEKVINTDTGCTDLAPSLNQHPAESTTPILGPLDSSESPSPKVELTDPPPPLVKPSTKRTKSPIHKAANSKTSNANKGSTQLQPEPVINIESEYKDLAPSLKEPPVESTSPVPGPLSSSSESPSPKVELNDPPTPLVKPSTKRTKPAIYKAPNSKTRNVNKGSAQPQLDTQPETVINTELKCKDLAPSLKEHPVESTTPVPGPLSSSSESQSPKVELSDPPPPLVKPSTKRTKPPIYKAPNSKTSNVNKASAQPQPDTVINTEPGCKYFVPSLKEPPVESTTPVPAPLSSSSESPSPKDELNEPPPPLVNPSTKRTKPPIHKAANTKTSNVNKGSTHPQPETVINIESGCKDLAPSLKEPPVESTTPVPGPLSSSSESPSPKVELTDPPPPLVKPSTKRTKPPIYKGANSKTSNVNKGSVQPQPDTQPETVINTEPECKDLAPSLKEHPVESTTPVPGPLSSSSESQSPKVELNDPPPPLVKPSTKRTKPAIYKAPNSKTRNVNKGSAQPQLDTQLETVINTEPKCKDLAPSLKEHPVESTTPVPGPLSSSSESQSPKVELSDPPPPLVKPSTKRTNSPIHKAANSKTSNVNKASAQAQPDTVINIESGCKDLAPSLKEPPVESTTPVPGPWSSSSESPSPKVELSDPPPPLVKPSTKRTKPPTHKAANTKTSNVNKGSAQSQPDTQPETVINTEPGCKHVAPSLKEPPVESTTPVPGPWSSSSESPSPKEELNEPPPPLVKPSTKRTKPPIHKAANTKTSNVNKGSAQSQPDTQPEIVINTEPGCKHFAPSLKEPPVESTTPVPGPLSSSSESPSPKEEPNEPPPPLVKPSTKRTKPPIHKAANSKTSNVNKGSAQSQPDTQPETVINTEPECKDLAPSLKEHPVESTTPVPGPWSSSSESQSPKVELSDPPPPLVKPSTKRTKPPIHKVENSKTSNANKGSTQLQPETVINIESECKDLAPSLKEPPLESTSPVPGPLSSSSESPSPKVELNGPPPPLVKPSTKRSKPAIHKAANSKTNKVNKASAQAQPDTVINIESGCKDLAPSLKEPPVESTTPVPGPWSSSSESPSPKVELSDPPPPLVKPSTKRTKPPIHKAANSKTSNVNKGSAQSQPDTQPETVINTEPECKDLAPSLKEHPVESTTPVPGPLSSSSESQSPKVELSDPPPPLVKPSTKRTKPPIHKVENSKTSNANKGSTQLQPETVINIESECKDLAPSLKEPPLESTSPVPGPLSSSSESQSPKVELSDPPPPLVKPSTKRSKPPIHKAANSKTSNVNKASAQAQPDTVINIESGCKDLAPSLKEPSVESTTPVPGPLSSSSESPSPKVELSDPPPPLVKPSTKRTKPPIHKAANSKTSNVNKGSAQSQPDTQPETVINTEPGSKHFAPSLKEPPVESTTAVPGPLSSLSESPSPKEELNEPPPPLAKPSTKRTKPPIHKATNSKTSSVNKGSAQSQPDTQPETVINTEPECKDLAPSLKEHPVESTTPVPGPLSSSSESQSPKVELSDPPPPLVKSSTKRTKPPIHKVENSKTSNANKGSTQLQPETVINIESECKDLAPSLKEPPLESTSPVPGPLSSSSESPSPKVELNGPPPPLVKPSTKRSKPAIHKAANSKTNKVNKRSTQPQPETVINTESGCKDLARSLKEPPVESATPVSDPLTSSREAPSPKDGDSDPPPPMEKPPTTSQADSKKGRSKYPKKNKTSALSSTANTASADTNLTSMKSLPMENIDIVETTENEAKPQVVADTVIKTEPMDEIEKSKFEIEDFDIKEEEVSVDAFDNPPLFANIDSTRHLKEIILKPSEVILTEEKINEQAEAHQSNRKKQKLKKPEQKGGKKHSNLSSNRIKAPHIRTAITATDNSTEPQIGNIQTARVSVEQVNQQGQEISLDIPDSGKDKCQLVTNAESGSIVERKETTERATETVETEDNASKITENVIAELKLLSPENFQNNEDEKELKKVETNVSVNIEMSSEPESHCDMNSCDVEKSDEEQKTAELLDSSIDIVLGNSSFTKSNLSPTNEETSSASNAILEKMEKSENKKSSGSSSLATPTKNRLDVLTAERINSALEKMLVEKNSLSMERKTDTRRQTINEDDGHRKQPSRSSLSIVKEISAKVPEALFADDESESSNADDSANEQFFAPILSLDDLLIKKDELTDGITNTYHRKENVEETETVHSRDGLGTPNFSVELEVETTDASDENTEKEQESVGDNTKVEPHCEGTVKCGEGAELNTNIEETDASFSLSAMTDISTIDIPSDLTINNEYPDLLDAMLYEQVRQSIDCMISGTNSAKKWSQDSFATSKAPVQFNHNEVETVSRDEEEDDVPLPQEKAIITTDDKTVTASEDALGIGQESFLGTINPLDEVEVPTTGFDLVGSFTIAEFLSEGGSDLFPFPELDKTQSRSNSFSADSSACNTPPPPFDAADESDPGDNKKDESATKHSQNTNYVACDHSYNKDINEAGKLETKVRKKSTSSNPTAFAVVQSTQKSPASKSPASKSPASNSPTMLNTFSRSKCHPKPFWKVRKTEEMKTSTPKKGEEQRPSAQNCLKLPATAEMKSIASQPDEKSINNKGKKLALFSMPALELVTDAAVPDAEVSASAVHKDGISKSVTATQPTELITSSKSIELSNPKENTSKISTAVAPKFDSANSKAEVSEEVSLKNITEKAQTQTVITDPTGPTRSLTPIEITEVITIPAPVIAQPIIRIQSQTNRLERIDPESSISQQVFLHTLQDNTPKLDGTPNTSKIDINNVNRPPRDSTPTLDERVKDEFELISPNNTIVVEASAGSSKHKESPTPLDGPPAKRLRIDNFKNPLSSNDTPSSYQTTNKTESSGLVTVQDSKANSLETESNRLKVSDTTELRKKVENIEESVASVPTKSCKGESNPILPQNNTLGNGMLPSKRKSIELSGEKLTENAVKDVPEACIFKSVEHHQLTVLKCNVEKSPTKDAGSKADLKPFQIRDNISKAAKVSLPKTPDKCEETCKKQTDVPSRLDPPKDIPVRDNQTEVHKQVSSSKTVLLKPYTPAKPANEPNPNGNKSSHKTSSTSEECSSARTNVAQVKNQKTSAADPGFTKATNPISKTTININKIIDNNTSSLAIATEKEVKNTMQQVSVKSNSGSKSKDLQTKETLIKADKKNLSPYQTSSISPRTKIPLKPTLAVAPTLLSNNTNRFHPYQRSQTIHTSSSTYRNKPTPQTQYTQAAAETNGRKRETTTRSDKTSMQRSTSTVTTLPLMQSRPTTSDMTLTITELATKKLSPADEADIAEKLRSYRAALPTAKTYGEHRENQRLIKLQEEKLRLEYAERANRRRAQQSRAEAQRLKRKSYSESFEPHYKKFSMLSGKSDGTSSRSGGHQSRSKQYQQYHSQRPRPHHEYVNKFGEIEKLVQKEKRTAYTESKRSGPLTASTAWEPKMPTGDELIELLSKTKKA